MTAATHFYRIAARAIAPILAVEGVRAIYVRRSVAAGDARFPWSDLDLAVVLDEVSGADLLRLWKRWPIARAVFPRLGEGQIFAPGDFEAYSATDPYRASLDRRFGYLAFGERRVIPERAVDERAAARRLVFWFQRYLPDVMRRGRIRDQRKLALETHNALGVLEGCWKEPLATRAETESRARSAGLLASDALERPFAAACRAAGRGCELLALRVPSISRVLQLKGLLIVPQNEADWPAAAPGSPGMVVTPAVLQMLLEMHDPFLWLEHGGALAPLGFAPPSRRAWLEAAARAARADLLRTPGFMGKSPQAVEAALGLAEQVVAQLESGKAVDGAWEQPTPRMSPSVAGFYRDSYNELAARGSSLHRRAMDLLRRA